MDHINIDGVILTPLKRIQHPKGEVSHGMKSSDAGFVGFGEAYLSEINYGEVKGWSKHIEMTLNLIVPVGEVTFVIYDERDCSSSRGQYFSVKISPLNYQRLTVPPGVWLAFKGNAEKLNLILNIANLEHDPNEMEKLPIDEIKYKWNSA